MRQSLSSNSTEPKRLSGISWFIVLYLAGIISLSLIAMLIKVLLAGL